MNSRNYIIRALNSPESLRLAKDKVRFKQVLKANGIPTPQTYDVIHDFTDMKLVSAMPDDFVVKPSHSFGGKGVVLLKREGRFFVNPSGDRYSDREVKLHIRKILDGDFSGFREQDVALVEQRIYPSSSLNFKDVFGLPDIRIVCANFEPVMAMLRYPTFKSKGRSNLSTGGIGMALSLTTGKVMHIYSKKEGMEYKPEEVGLPATFVMPKWEEMKAIAKKCSQLSGLKLSGVDIILSSSDEVMVLEINGRPGLEIQNINESSLLKAMREVKVAILHTS
jgi:alpha-L-glutamate ligase-like protein